MTWNMSLLFIRKNKIVSLAKMLFFCGKIRKIGIDMDFLQRYNNMVLYDIMVNDKSICRLL